MAAGAVREPNRWILLMLWFAVIGGIPTSASEVCEDTEGGSDQTAYKLIGRLMLIKPDGDCTPVDVKAVMTCASAAEDGAAPDEQKPPPDVEEDCEDGEHIDEATGVLVPNCPKDEPSDSPIDIDETFPGAQEVEEPAVVEESTEKDEDKPIIDDLLGTIIEESSEGPDADLQEEDSEEDDDDDHSNADADSDELDTSEDYEDSEMNADDEPEEESQPVIVSREEDSTAVDDFLNDIIGSMEKPKTIIDRDSAEPESSERVGSDAEEQPAMFTESVAEEPNEPADAEFENLLNGMAGPGSDTNKDVSSEKVGSDADVVPSVQDGDGWDELSGSDEYSSGIENIIDDILDYDPDVHKDPLDVSDESSEEDAREVVDDDDDDKQDAQDIANIMSDLITMDSVEREDISKESPSEATPTATIPIATFNNSLDTKNMVCMDVNIVMQHLQQHHAVDFGHSMVVSPRVGPFGKYLASSVANTATWLENRLLHCPKLTEYTNRKSGLETLEHFLSHPKTVENVLESKFDVLLKLLEDHMPQIAHFLDVVLEDVHENSEVLQYLLKGQGKAAYEYIKNGWHSKRR